MTVKEASVLLGLSEKEIRKRQKQDMLPPRCAGDTSRGAIPDNTKIIPSKHEIQAFLLQIVRFKNNEQHIIARQLCPTDESLEILFEYLYQKGFIGEYIFDHNIAILFNRVKLTDAAFQFLFGEAIYQKIGNIQFTALAVNPKINIGGLNIGC